MPGADEVGPAVAGDVHEFVLGIAGPAAHLGTAVRRAEAAADRLVHLRVCVISGRPGAVLVDPHQVDPAVPVYVAAEVLDEGWVPAAHRGDRGRAAKACLTLPTGPADRFLLGYLDGSAGRTP